MILSGYQLGDLGHSSWRLVLLRCPGVEGNLRQPRQRFQFRKVVVGGVLYMLTSTWCAPGLGTSLTGRLVLLNPKQLPLIWTERKGWVCVVHHLERNSILRSTGIGTVLLSAGSYDASV